MQTFLKVLCCLCILLSVPILSHGKDWRGIIPMRSTRADVEALLGEPPPPLKDGSRLYVLHKGRSIYFLDEGEVYIVFVQPEHSCASKISEGTVLMIQVTPKKELALTDLPIDQTKFRKFDPSTPPNIGFEAYINEQEGLLVRTYQGKVDKIVYIASAADKGLCPDYYNVPESMVGTTVCGLSIGYDKFDELGDLSGEDERARLDNFAIQLVNQTDYRGYIIVYAGRRARAGEAFLRANRARDYLVRKRNIDVGQVIAIDGGHREDFTIEMFVGPADATPPEPMPTVELREVEIIYDQPNPRKRRRG